MTYLLTCDFPWKYRVEKRKHGYAHLGLERIFKEKSDQGNQAKEKSNPLLPFPLLDDEFQLKKQEKQKA